MFPPPPPGQGAVTSSAFISNATLGSCGNPSAARLSTSYMRAPTPISTRVGCLGYGAMLAHAARRASQLLQLVRGRLAQRLEAALG